MENEKWKIVTPTKKTQGQQACVRLVMALLGVCLLLSCPFYCMQLAKAFFGTPSLPLHRSPHTFRRLATQAGPPLFTIFYNDVHHVPLPANHRFPMKKYGQVRRMVQEFVREHDQDNHCRFVVSPMASPADLETTHCPNYISRFIHGDQTPEEQRNVGFPWSKEGVRRALSSTGGTVAAALTAVEQKKCAGWAAHVAGGTHHAFYDYGEGFCVFSDIAVAVNVLQRRYPERIRRVLILDLDVHQGNGNAVLFQDNPNVFTFSIHCSANYFSRKESSDLDIELPVDCNDATYIATLGHWLNRLKEEAGPFDFIFYQAGVDILDCDRLGRMKVSAKGIARRDQLVFEFCRSLQVPVVITMGGGYPKANAKWEPILNAHANVYTGAYLFRKAWVGKSTEAIS